MPAVSTLRAEARGLQEEVSLECTARFCLKTVRGWRVDPRVSGMVKAE